MQELHCRTRCFECSRCALERGYFRAALPVAGPLRSPYGKACSRAAVGALLPPTPSRFLSSVGKRFIEGLSRLRYAHRMNRMHCLFIRPLPGKRSPSSPSLRVSTGNDNRTVPNSQNSATLVALTRLWANMRSLGSELLGNDSRFGQWSNRRAA